MEKFISRILISEEQIKNKVKELGEQITNDYQDKDLLVICILKGAVIFMADLIREIKIPLNIDTMVVSSYGSSTESSGVVRILKDLDESVENRDILIVEDIVDTGLTLKYLMDNIISRGPKSVKICSFLDKPERRKVNIVPDYKGYSIPDEFVVGYGLDYAEKYRNLPYIAVLNPEVYS
ncbi:MAG: hypoxanthine phosphoribosyltransferase [Clostridia bacterium]|jgi:hypoxanthine phosphoribosyltransferase|nr:hypoxanthine phosphoribosyltransferase [Clostridia bacterium]MDN5322803.1 hypoxanthine phosphoribosyltransferase [Clostridia bacterium]